MAAGALAAMAGMQAKTMAFQTGAAMLQQVAAIHNTKTQSQIENSKKMQDTGKDATEKSGWR
jgi:hypothetical protein